MKPEEEYRALVRKMLRGAEPYPLHLEQAYLDIVCACVAEQQKHCADIIRSAADEYGELDFDQLYRLSDVVENHYRDDDGQTQITIKAE